MNETNFSVRLTAAEYVRLVRLAEESGRSKGGVIRRLLALSDVTESRRSLGADTHRIVLEPREDSLNT